MSKHLSCLSVRRGQLTLRVGSVVVALVFGIFLSGCGGGSGGSGGGGGGTEYGGNDTANITYTAGPKAGTNVTGGLPGFQLTISSNGTVSGENTYGGPTSALGSGINSGSITTAGFLNLKITSNQGGLTSTESDSGTVSYTPGGSIAGTISGSGSDSKGNTWTIVHQLNLGVVTNQ